MRPITLALVSSLVVACGGGSDPADAGGEGMDAGASVDAGGGGADAGDDAGDAPDAGELADAGDSDGGEHDAGDGDAGAMDAGDSDAGDSDAGASDAGASDAGPGVDADGTCDAMDVMEGTPCGPTERPAPRYVWNGRSCEFAAWCRCLGADCLEVYRDEAACLAVYRGCLPSCASDSECTSGSEWCEGGNCVACDNSGLLCDIACSPSRWATYTRNGCHPCECGPPSECQGDAECASGERCYAGDFCWCPGGARSPECCLGNICAPSGCPEPPPTGCNTRGCPRGQECGAGSGCAPSSCFCGGGSWACTRDCGGGTCATP